MLSPCDQHHVVSAVGTKPAGTSQRCVVAARCSGAGALDPDRRPHPLHVVKGERKRDERKKGKGVRLFLASNCKRLRLAVVGADC